jgi:hypothetical protein
MCSFFQPTVLNNYMVISSYRQRVILEVHNQTGQTKPVGSVVCHPVVSCLDPDIEAKGSPVTVCVVSGACYWALKLFTKVTNLELQ